MGDFNQMNIIIGEFLEIPMHILPNDFGAFNMQKTTWDFHLGGATKNLLLFQEKLETINYTLTDLYIEKEANEMSHVIAELTDNEEFKEVYVFSGKYRTIDFAYVDMMYEIIQYLSQKLT